MELLHTLTNLHFSLYTLIAFNFFPFVAFYFRNDKSFAFPLSVIFGIVALIVLYKMPEVFADKAFFIVGMCHLLQVVVSIMILYVSPGMAATAPATSGGKKIVDKRSLGFHQLNAQDVENLTWDDVIIKAALKKELLSVISMLKDPKIATDYGIELPKGILFTGPPGNGKTTIAKVIAGTAGLSFFVLNIAEIVSKWVGDSEKNISALFNAAQKASPAVIFIDEIDAIGGERGSGANHGERLLNHVLQLIDGVIQAKGIYIIGATNRPQSIDPALKRPGRLNKIIEIPNPDIKARKQLFELYLKKLPLEDEVDVNKLAESTPSFSGADVKEVCNQAGLRAFGREQHLKSKERTKKVTVIDLVSAISDLKKGKGF